MQLRGTPYGREVYIPPKLAELRASFGVRGTKRIPFEETER